MSVRLETTNGAHSNTIIITSNFQINVYYSIKNKEEVTVNEYDFEKVQILISKLHKKANIVIDSRLNYILLATHFMYPDYCLVFDIEDSHIKNIYGYMSSRSVLDLRGLYLYTVNGKKIMDLYMFIKHFCTNLQINWNTDRAIEICNNNISFVDIVLNYIGIQKYIQEDDRIASLIKDVNTIVRDNFSKRKLIFADINELYSTFIAMNMMENTIKVYYH